MEIACQGKQNEQFFLPFPLLSSSDLCLLIHEGFVVTLHTLVWRGKKNKEVAQNASWQEKIKCDPDTLLCKLIHLQANCIPEETQLSNVIKPQSQLPICIHILTCILSVWC